MSTCSPTDPSANVLLLVGNAVKYLEALHQSSERGLDERLKVHFEYARQNAEAETKRIDTLRAVDVAAVNTANERAIGQASVLANQVATSAETLRTLVAQTANTIAKQFESTTTTLTERIAQLEKAQYENVGKSGASSTILQRVADLEKTESRNSGRAGLSAPILMTIAGLAGGIVVWAIQRLIGP